MPHVRAVAGAKSIKIEEIGRGLDLSFSWPSPLLCEELYESVRAFGVIHPVAVNSSGELLSGARRLEALKEAGACEVAAVEVALHGPELFDWLLAEQMLARPLNLVEVGLYLNKRMKTTGEGFGDIPHATLQRLGLSPKINSAAEALFCVSLDDEARDRVAQGEIQKSALRHLSALSKGDADAILNATAGFRFGQNKFAEVARWLSECALRDGVGVDAWLDKLGIAKEAKTAEEFRNMLNVARYPTLSGWAQSFEADRGSIPLPKKVSLSHNQGFEGGELTLTLPFASVEELGQKAGEIQKLAFNGHLGRLSKYLAR